MRWRPTYRKRRIRQDRIDSECGRFFILRVAFHGQPDRFALHRTADGYHHGDYLTAREAKRAAEWAAEWCR